LIPQFLILTAIFMALSVSSLSLYAALASRAKGVLVRPELSRWVSQVVGVTFIGFGAAILAIRR
jgi:threonine/homoserine/homoserine lactone efflux protein